MSWVNKLLNRLTLFKYAHNLPYYQHDNEIKVSKNCFIPWIKAVVLCFLLHFIIINLPTFLLPNLNPELCVVCWNGNKYNEKSRLTLRRIFLNVVLTWKYYELKEESDNKPVRFVSCSWFRIVTLFPGISHW